MNRIRRRQVVAGAFSMIVFVDVFFNGMAQFLVLRQEVRQSPEIPTKIMDTVIVTAALAEHRDRGQPPSYKEALIADGTDLIATFHQDESLSNEDDVSSNVDGYRVSLDDSPSGPETLTGEALAAEFPLDSFRYLGGWFRGGRRRSSNRDEA